MCLFLHIGAVRAYIQSPTPSAIPAVVPVPSRVRLLDRNARLLVPVPLQRFLQSAVQQAWQTVQDLQWSLYGESLFTSL
jgi:hypothetical protein